MMMSSPFLARVSRGLSLTVVALAFASGVSMVRAQSDVPSWILVDPTSSAVKAVEERLTSLEAKVASVAELLTSRQSTEHELCVADEAGARTCISKVQLDRLLKIMQAAAIEPPAQATNSVAALAEPAEPTPAVSAPETKAAAVEEPTKIEKTIGVEAPRQAEQAAAETLEPDSMPTGSIPTPESQGRAVVTHPEVEITTPPIEN
jgi:hypothetical protein